MNAEVRSGARQEAVLGVEKKITEMLEAGRLPPGTKFNGAVKPSTVLVR